MTLPATLAQSLGVAADAEIRSVLANGGGGVSRPAGEVAAVAAVVLGSVPQIAAAWTRILKGLYSCSITGVFIHGSPQVTFIDSAGIKKRCELGDLLIVLDHVGSNGVVDRRASLIQAKLTPPPGAFTLASGGQVQLDLYANWYPFDFVSSAFLSHTRDFNSTVAPGLSSDSGTFGGVDLVSSPREWRQTAPSSAMTTVGATELGSFIADMATGLGNVRPATVGGSDDWSFTVAELLSKTGALLSAFGVDLKTKKSRRKTVVAFQIPTVSGYPFLVLPPPAFVTIARDPPPPPDENGRPPKDGISIIHATLVRTG